ncbi:hypothetical protein P154DRAFT_598473 [Amniculicola lignicola CBS 123094]|uniref:Uncharacterized protein n=1 Tax=Amniculicola lignicola CBS 123094 TaxID=1392246 RepID=A0A6A5WHW2_9PLEO|nr:hypothetical protein P154DRAFT_598473 [Amniculicola lignicola CBS 123094]
MHLLPPFPALVLGIFCVKIGVHGLPHAASKSNTHVQYNDMETGSLYPSSTGGMDAFQVPNTLENRAVPHKRANPKGRGKKKKTEKGKTSEEVVETPQNDPPKKLGKGKGKEKVTDSDEETIQTPPGKVLKFRIGVCGTDEEGPVISNIATGKSQPRPPLHRILKTPATPDKYLPDAGNDAELGTNKKSSGTKDMAMCSSKVKMKFPDYVTSPRVISNPKMYAKIIKAYNALDHDPCNNNYEFGNVPFPDYITLGVAQTKKLRKPNAAPPESDIWQTEHAMDAQIMKIFLTKVFKTPKDVPASLPEAWIKSVRAEDRLNQNNMCNYLDQFWTKRFPHTEPNAMDHLLSVFPGTKYLKEFFLLPGNLNSRKSTLFGLDGNNVITTMRDVVLLRAYMNEPLIQMAWKKLAIRIRDRLAEIEEGPEAYIRKTDDYWFTISGETTDELKDADDGKYVSLGLSKKWSIWIDKFVKDRMRKMGGLLEVLWLDFEADWLVAQRYADLPPKDRKILHTRVAALEGHIMADNDLAGMMISSSSGKTSPATRPADEQPEDQRLDPDTPVISDSDGDGIPDETPSKPGPSNQDLPERLKGLGLENEL